ncbi:tetratricopeptide repeat protein [Sphingobacterium sp. DK4209]|uniref:Tetratricopeptide repeat protein n=1 Tax=Sphingobacterium zhuxiongii TaxID=2662364 RepID=A0A5Q0QEJ3_9SPHI|nr:MULTISPECIES: tetratricopeptide repeat protein [unclassified Sphingobacterium]MVZ65481.1 tetratricopeptide repeat protein [Sphingobacterium sp. DK4209]QGA27371.1 tetratricopeptide repeat protein [Sphingobacterium sp. dk4302]
MRRTFKCRVWFAGLFLLIGQSVFGQQELKQEPGYKESLAAIETQLKRGDVGNALNSIEETLAKYPQGSEVFYAKSLLFAQARNFEVAIPAAQRAVEIDPSNLVYGNHLMELYKSEGDFDAAVGLIDQVISKHSDRGQLYREKIMLLHAAKKSEEALKVYDITKGKFGESDTLDVLKAEILMDLKQPSEAKKVLQVWDKKNSPIRQVYSTLSYIYLDEKNPKEAISVLDRGIVNSKDDLLYLDLADAYNVADKDKLAFDYVKKAFESNTVNFLDKHRVMMTILNGKSKLTLDQKQELANLLVLKHPRIPDTHMFKGDILWQKGELAQAKSLFLTTVGMNPRHIDAWSKLINIDLNLNELDEAIQHGNEALSHNPGSPVLTYFVGMAHFIKKDNEQARQYLERALDQSANENGFVQSMIYAGLGDLYHEIKMESASDVAYEEAVTRDSTNVTAMNNYAYYLSVRKENLDKAAEYAARANELEPNSGTFQDTYAWVLFQKGQYKEALNWIERAVKNSEPSAVLFEHYGDILMKSGKSKEAIKQWEKAQTLNDVNSAVDKDKLKRKISEKKYLD